MLQMQHAESYRLRGHGRLDVADGMQYILDCQLVATDHLKRQPIKRRRRRVLDCIPHTGFLSGHGRRVLVAQIHDEEHVLPHLHGTQQVNVGERQCRLETRVDSHGTMTVEYETPVDAGVQASNHRVCKQAITGSAASYGNRHVHCAGP